MIKYKLICKDCDLTFDSWFASSKEFDNLKKKNFLNCHVCDSKKIEKTLMSPKINIQNSKLKTLRQNNINKKIKEYQKFIKKNFEYVGENFAYEARAIHFDNKNKKKGIYGKASFDEFKELKEDGVEVEMIPWLNDKSN